MSFPLGVSVSIHIGSLMFHMYYSACVECGACSIGTMHVHARIEGLHVYALGMFLHVSDIIKSWACIYICWLISRDECVLAFVGNWECICIRWLLSRARSMYQELSGYLHVPASTKNCPLCLHLPARIEGWACPCMCVHVRSLLSDSSRQYQVLLCNHQLIKLRLAITHATL